MGKEQGTYTIPSPKRWAPGMRPGRQATPETGRSLSAVPRKWVSGEDSGSQYGAGAGSGTDVCWGKLFLSLHLGTRTREEKA